MTQVRRDEDAWRMIGEMRNEIAQLQRVALPPELIVDGRLPENPYPDQIADFQVQEGTVWRFRYNAGSASSRKWESIGGNTPIASFWHAANSAQTGTGSGNYDKLPTGSPTLVTLPIAGDYDFSFGGSGQEVSGSGAAADVYMRLFEDVSNTALGSAYAEQEAWARGIGPYGKWRIVSETRYTDLAAGLAVGVRGSFSSASWASFGWYSAFLKATPVRVG